MLRHARFAEIGIYRPVKIEIVCPLGRLSRIIWQKNRLTHFGSGGLFMRRIPGFGR